MFHCLKRPFAADVAVLVALVLMTESHFGWMNGCEVVAAFQLKCDFTYLSLQKIVRSVEAV